MKTARNITSGIIILGLVIIILTSCGSAKYSSNFKNQKKYLDTLTIFTPLVTVVAKNSKINYIDSVLTHSVQLLIEKQTFDLLSSKYRLEKKQLAQIDQKSFDKIYSQIENSGKRISGILCDSILIQVDQNYKNKFALLIIYNGEINPDYGPHYNISAGMASNGIIIAPQTKPYSDLRLMIIDTEIREIVFFDRINSSNYDPRVDSEIEHITKTILRNIYYQ